MFVRSNWRYLALCAALVIALVSAVTYGSTNEPAGLPLGEFSEDYDGTDMGGVESPTFTLTNQTGQRVSLSDYRGRVVLLTFLDGHCDDICPLLLETMARVEEDLGSVKDRVAFVAISVNPWLDVVGKPAFIAYQPDVVSPKEWDFLTGTLEELQPVWDAYYVGVQWDDQPGSSGMIHSEGYYIIDSDGQLQRYYNGSISAKRLADGIRNYVNESSF